MNEILSLMNVVGALCFIVAFRYAWKIIPRSGESLGYWIIFSFAMVMGFAWSLAVSLEGFGMVPSFFHAAATPLLAVAAADLIICSILSFVALTRPFD
ncbi:MAG: hypothetical protein AABX02_03525 [archaeon]